MTPFTDNTGKVLTKYIKARDGTTLTLTYRREEAQALRSLVQSIRLKGDKTPSLSLIAKRAMRLYLDLMTSGSAQFASEIAALERLATPVPTRAPSKAPA